MFSYLSKYSGDFSPFQEEEDMFSDTEASNIEDSIVVVNVSEDKTKSIEIVTLGDSISSDSETESPKPKKTDENKAVEKNIMTKVEPQDDETTTGEDNSSIKESSNNDDNPITSMNLTQSWKNCIIIWIYILEMYNDQLMTMELLI